MHFHLHVFRRMRLGVILVGLLVVLGSQLPASLAADSVTIDDQTVRCSRITVTYTVTGAATEDYGIIYAHRADGTELGLVGGPGSNGQHTVAVTFPQQPAGTQLYARVSVGIGEAGRVEDQGAPTACGGNQPGPPTSDESNAVIRPAPPWEGFSDGRLNPDRAEPYSIWCSYDRIDVWRAVPQSQLLHSFWLTEVLVMPDGNTLNGPAGMTLTRVGDTITIAGYNNNYAPEWRSKSFSLSECLTRNGNTPALPEESGADDSPPVVASPCSFTAPRVTLQLDESISPLARGSASNLILLTEGFASVKYQVEDNGDEITVELESDRPERADGSLRAVAEDNAACLSPEGLNCNKASVLADGVTWYELWIGSGEIARPESEPRTLLTLRFTDSDGCVNVHGIQVNVIDRTLPGNLLLELIRFWASYLCEGPIVLALVLPTGILARRIRRRPRT